MNTLEQRLKKGNITFITDHSDEMDEATMQRLKQYDNCVLYPSIAYISDEAKVAKQEIFLNNMRAFLEGNPQNKVN